MDMLFCRGPCKVRNETKTKQIETKQNKTNRNETGRNETKQNIKLKEYEKRRKKIAENEYLKTRSACNIALIQEFYICN